MPPWLLLIDPTDTIFDGLTNEFSQRFDVIVVDDQEGAQEAIDDEGNPHVMALSFDQGSEDGMAVAQRLRKRVGDEVMVIVYGLPPVGHAMRDGMLRKLERKHGVDLFAHQEFGDGYLLGKAIWNHLLDEQYLDKQDDHAAPPWLPRLQQHKHLKPTLSKLLALERQVTRRDDPAPVRQTAVEREEDAHSSSRYRRQRGEADMEDILESPLTGNNLRMLARKARGGRVMRRDLNA